MINRVFLIVLDSLGVGELPDASAFGDVGADTMKTISSSENFRIDFLKKIGLSCVSGLGYLGENPSPIGAYGKMNEVSAGKDSTIGHWEISGLNSTSPFPTYPEGFPDEILDEFKRATGRGVICNKPYSGLDVIRDYGEEHMKTGSLIVYTSADSVFQIAANEEIVPLEQLYEYCRIARKMLVGKHCVGRVIARPFVEVDGKYVRTKNRHDFSVEPTGETMLDAMKASGLDVLAVGKINDIFAGRGITKYYPTHDNNEGMAVARSLLSEDFKGLCFVNLVDFDMVFGHRNDIDGYASALSVFDKWAEDFASGMKDDDILLITADHGCDPGDSSTDHTREYVPILAVGKSVKPANLGIRNTFSDVAATIMEIFGVNYNTHGTSFLKEMTI